MDANQLLELVTKYQEHKDFISNEETAKVALVIPFIRLLGYDPTIPREVRLEYAADFVQGDGKKLPDRMDFAIFDQTGVKPLMVIETKPLGTDLKSRSQQLARYLAQMPELHFGMITDGCQYMLFGDLEQPNVMDPEPFFTFSLDDAKSDWTKVAKFLSKFSREAFNAATLITDAENSRYRQAMIEKLAAALKSPSDDIKFLKWLTEDIYKGNRTSGVMERLGEVAREAIEPTLLRVMGDDFLEKLKERIQRLNESGDLAGQSGTDIQQSTKIVEAGRPGDEQQMPATEGRQKLLVETTPEELEFFSTVRDICVKCGQNPEDILCKDTTAYFNVSFRHPTKWFVRFFGNGKRKSITTWVPVDDAKRLAAGLEVDAPPAAYGASRIYVDSVAQVWAIQSIVLWSFQLCVSEKDEPAAQEDPTSTEQPPSLKVV